MHICAHAGLVNEGRAVDVVYLDFSKAFDTVSHKILIEELLMYGMDEQRVKWTENWATPRPRGWSSVTQSLVGGQ